jgi:sialate O-acetylesterase
MKALKYIKFIRVCLWLSMLVLGACSKKPAIDPQKPVAPDAFSLGSPLQANMVVQRDKPFVIWGNAGPKVKITVNVSWNHSSFNTVSDDAGGWMVTVPASPANSNPQSILAKPAGGGAITLTNVLIGDVWICSGQSNMVMPLSPISPFTGVLDYETEIAAANYPLIRTLTLQSDNEALPITRFTAPAAWTVCSPANAGSIGAVAYFFGRKISTVLNVPVGIIVSAYNGSSGQDWANASAIASDPTLQQLYGSGSSGFYNGMINPLTRLAIKGFTWYQGESNQHDNPENYTRLSIALIKGWRAKFNDNALPFYLVQLTPFAEDYNTSKPPGGDKTLNYLAKFREGQANTLSLTGTGMAVTMDVGEENNHHPRNKKPVGERLALLALNNAYGKFVECYGPQYSSWQANGSTVIIHFKPGTANGLTTAGDQPLKQFFFVAGTDNVFRQGTAVIRGSDIIVTAPADTPMPIQAVRYAFTNAPVTNLQNSAGLPAAPFRTDSWSN